MDDAHLFKLAKEESKKADYCGCAGNVAIGSVIVYHGSVLARGHNSNKTHSQQAKFNKWRYKNEGNKYLPSKLHSELMALNKIKYLDIDFSKVHLYIYRQYKDGTLALSKPCPSCEAAIREMGIRHVHYTGSGSYIYEKYV